MGRATGTGKTSLGALDAAKALAGMIGSGARGALASTLGFPGDIESLLAEFVLGEGADAPTVLPTIDDMRRTLPNLPPSLRVPMYEDLGTFAATTPGAFARGAVRPAARAAARFLDDAMLTGQGPLGTALAAARPMNVIKERGGNWLGGSVEDSLRPLLRHEPIKQSLNLEPELEAAYPAGPLQASKRAAYLNNWIQGPLRKYVMRDMASPADPIRKLAEQGVLHVASDALPLAPIRESSLIARRQATGFPPQGIATSDLGRLWERNADASVYPRTAERAMVSDPNWHPEMRALHRERALLKDPWLANLDPSSQVLSPEVGMASRLGFDHLVDVLNSDIQAGMLRPEQLNKVSVSDAVRRAYDFNARQAAETAKARMASMADIPVVKDYPEAGMKWVELRHPEVNSLDDIVGEDAVNKTAKWLKEEGDAMGHCVGGYCDDVLAGRSRIFSLRDAQGMPHVTIETQKGTTLWADTDASDALRDSLRNQAYEAPHIKEAEARLASRIAQGDSRAQDQLDEMVNAYITDAWEKLPQPETHSIIQIKGKQNKAPVEKYLPMVQDFVKNHGPWADVGDLQNTGLRYFKEPSPLYGVEADITIPAGYHSQEDLRKLFLDAGVPESNVSGWMRAEGFAGGGLVKGLASRMAKYFAEPETRKGVASIVKETGGNWLGSSVEGQMARLNKRVPVPEDATARIPWGPEDEVEAAQARAVNNWVKGPLTKYVKRDMATADDPIRKLAEQGILHFEPQPTRITADAHRIQALHLGAPGQPMAPLRTLGRAWEDAADATVSPGTIDSHAPLHQSAEEAFGPWAKGRENELGYVWNRGRIPEDLGFDHLVDVLKSDMQAGLLRPEQLNKVSVADAVRRAHAFNERQAAEMAKARIASMAGMPVVKEYPEHGMRWVELKKPDAAPEGWTFGQVGNNPRTVGWTDPNGKFHLTGNVPDFPIRNTLQKWLKEEGDTMGHCVGGYCDDVLSGTSRIFSLRDAKGQPHVTIEVVPNLIDASAYSGNKIEGRLTQDEMIQKIKEWETNPEEVKSRNDTALRHGLTVADPTRINLSSWIKDIQEAGQGIPYIKQVKGKLNRAPIDQYLPFVQDFVKNQGPWSDVRDLQNTGLLDLMAPSARDVEYNQRLMDTVGGRYATQDAVNEALERLRQDAGFAEGGAVEDPIQKIIEEAGGQYAGGGLVKSARSAYDVVQRLLRDSPALQGRAEELVARAPTTFNVIDPVPLSRSLRSSPSALMTPQEFLQAARPLPMSNADYDIVSGLRNYLDSKDAGRYEDLFSSPLYNRRLFRGFDAPPALELSNDYFLPAVAGHDGRHRMLAIQGLYGNVPILTDLKTPLAPRSYLKSEKFREAPEWWNEMQTQTVPAPKPFAEGGPVEIIKSCGGRYE